MFADLFGTQPATANKLSITERAATRINKRAAQIGAAFATSFDNAGQYYDLKKIELAEMGKIDLANEQRAMAARLNAAYKAAGIDRVIEL